MLNLQKIIIVHLAEFNCAVILKEIRNGLPINFFFDGKRLIPPGRTTPVRSR